MDDASGPAGASRGYNTRQLHVMAPRLVEQTIERAGIVSLGGSYAIGPFPNHTGFYLSFVGWLDGPYAGAIGEPRTGRFDGREMRPPVAARNWDDLSRR
jgi:hypothetical protein